MTNFEGETWLPVHQYGQSQEELRREFLRDPNDRGFDIPPLIDRAGLTESFEQCFDLSAQLYSHMQAAGYEAEAQYATLQGHKMRWTFSYSAGEALYIYELGTSPHRKVGSSRLLQEMHEQVAIRHPLLAQAMKPADLDESSESIRLVTEGVAQHQLKQLGNM